MDKYCKKLFSTTLFIAVLFFFASCSGPKRAAIRKELSPAKELQKTEAAKIEATNETKQLKLAEENIDTIINSNVSLKLTEFKNHLDSFKESINFVDSVIKTGSLYRKNKAQVQDHMAYIRNYINNTYQRFRRMQMIDDGLQIAEQHLFQLGAFFGPGKFEIPEEKMNEAVIAFTPILDSLTNFYNRYSDVERSATLRVIGFADGSGFNKESEIYGYLTKLLNDSLATKETLNQKLSELRAKNIADLMQLILSKKIANYQSGSSVDFIFLETGKGEALPSKKITDYSENDDRRRVVLLFWNILPK